MSRRKKWIDYAPEECETVHSFPSDLFDDVQPSEDNYSLISTHPVCLSCYSLGGNQFPPYHLLLNEERVRENVVLSKEVADEFDLTLDTKKQEWPIEELFEKITEIIDKSREEGSSWTKSNISMSLKDIENKLQILGRCIRSRIYHHKNCSTRNPEVRIKRKPVHLGNLFGDVKHDTFIIQLCYHINMLYNYYLALIYHYNYIFQTVYINQIEVDLQDIFNHCDRKLLTIDVNNSNVLDKQYLIEERNKYIIQKTKENKKSSKKSRRRSKPSYKALKQIRVVKYKTYGLERENK